MEHGTETSSSLATLMTQNSSSTSSYYGSCFDSYNTRIEYELVSMEFRRLALGKFFISRFRESYLQWFWHHLRLSFSKILMQLKNLVIQDMEVEFGKVWSVKKAKLQCHGIVKVSNVTKKNLKLHPDQRHKKGQWTYL